MSTIQRCLSWCFNTRSGVFLLSSGSLVSRISEFVGRLLARAFQSTPQTELNRYLIELRSMTPVGDALKFWQERRNAYPLLSPLAEDLVSAPASQAFVERIFSVYGMLTAGRRNRMEKSLEMRVFLRMNSHMIN